MATCSFDDCGHDASVRGWCWAHYLQWRATGTLKPRLDTPEKRFRAKVEVNPETACWEWTGSIDRKGYGRFWHEGRWAFAHRVAYGLFVGPPPDGLELDHLCRNTRCSNPSHLEPVTHLENMRRAVFQLKTHCVNGHEFTPENTYRHPKRGSRHCKACQRDRDRRSRKVA